MTEIAMPAAPEVTLDHAAILEALAGLRPELAAAPAEGPGTGLAAGGPAITGAVLDSRTVRPGELFVALPGTHAHGARFVAAALGAGAALALVGRQDAALVPSGADRSRILWVDDAARGLTALGRAARRRARHLVVVAVTGSFGKTTTKEMVAAALGSALRVHRTPGNFNNQLGVPLTLLGLTPRHEAAVVELGMNAPGEIAALAALAAPEIGVVTGVGRAHLAGLKSRAAIIAAKLELAPVLGAEGLLVLPAGDPELFAAARRSGTRILTVSAAEGAAAAAAPAAPPGREVPAPSLRAAAIELGPESVRFTAHGLGLDGLRVSLPVPARVLVENALLALAVGAHLGIDGAGMARALASVRLPERRLTLRRAGGILVLDDCYNANPESMAAALATLAELDVRRRIGVLGDMRELGAASGDAHRELGERAARVLDRLHLIGEEAETVAEAARAAGMAPPSIRVAADREALVRDVLRDLEPGDGLLVKASRAVGLEAVVEAVMRRERS